MVRSLSGEKTRSRTVRAQEELAAIFDRQRKTLRRLTSISLVLRMAPLVVPVLLRFTLDPILKQSAVTTPWGPVDPNGLLMLLIVAGCVAALVRGAAGFVFVSLSGRCGHTLVADLRAAMFEHILRLPARYVRRRGTGRVLLRFIGDSDALRVWFSRTWPAVVADRILLAVLSVGMMAVSPALSLAVIVPMLLTLCVILLLTPGLRRRTRAARSLQASFTGRVESFLSSIAYGKWLAAFRDAVRGVTDAADDVCEANIHRERFAAAVRLVGATLAFLPVPLLGWFGVQSVWAGTLGAGQFVAMTWLAVHTAVVLQRLSLAAVQEAKAMVSVHRILRILERKAEPGRSSRRKKTVRIRHRIRFRNLILKPDGREQPTAALSLELKSGDPPVLLRESGYRTAFDALMGVRPVESGELLIDGQSADVLSIRRLRRQIGWYAVRPIIVQGSILENIFIARPGADGREVEDIAGRLLENAGDVSEWLAQSTGADGWKLSVDDRHRLQIARIALRRPSMVFIDAPDVDWILNHLETAGLRIGIVCVRDPGAEVRAVSDSERPFVFQGRGADCLPAMCPELQPGDAAGTADSAS